MAKPTTPNVPADSTSGTFDVGYKKPPKAGQFKKGQSGNPSGRPKDRRNLATELNLALNETVTVTENGRRRKITKRAAICRQLTNRSTAGDLAALRLLLPLMGLVDAAEATDETVFTADLDQVLAKSLLARLGALPADEPEEEQ